MQVLYKIIVDGKSFDGIKADKADCAGHWYNGKAYRPNDAEIEQALPHRLRAAFNRTSKRFWFDNAHNDVIDGLNFPSLYECKLYLYSTRGKQLAIIRALPYVQCD